MPKIDESDLDVGNEPPFVARNIVIKQGQNPRDDYSFSDELGRGRFGRVLKCTEKKTGLKLAAKFVRTRAKEEKENVQREVDIMKSLQHRRLMQLYDVYDNGQEEMCIITELISGGELFERVIDDDFELTEKVCAIFMRQICEGVDYMHQKFIMHLDMKPENILCVTRTGNRIKLIDFGLARYFDPKKTLQVMFGTPDFASPEVLSYDRVTPAADMWSVGVICYVLLSGFSPFMGNSDLETMTNVTKAIYDFDDDSFDPITAEAKDFISKLLIKEPGKRLKPADCLKHKWLAKTAAKPGKVTKLSKTKLKKYVVRRRWQKAANAIMALRRMGANLSLTGAGDIAPASKVKSSSTTTTTTTTTKSPTQAKVFSSTSSYTSSARFSTSGSSSKTTQPSATGVSTSRASSTIKTCKQVTSKPPTPASPPPRTASSFQTSSYSTSSSSTSSSNYRLTNNSTSSSSTSPKTTTPTSRRY